MKAAMTDRLEAEQKVDLMVEMMVVV